MTEWWTYGISDLVPFAADAYWRLFAHENLVFWPVPLVAAVAAGALVLKLLKSPGEHWGYPVPLLLGGCWIWVGWNFVLHRYGTLNWAGDWLVWPFLLQGALLCILANRVEFAPIRDTRTRAGAAVILVACCLYPGLAILDGRSLLESEAFGIAPDPTVLATLGVLSMTRRHSFVLVVIPALWLAVSCLVLLTIGAWQGLVVAVLGAAALWAAARPRGIPTRPGP